MRALKLIVILIATALSLPGHAAVSCRAYFGETFTRQETRIEGIPVKYRQSENPFNVFTDLALAGNDVFLVVTAGHVKILFGGRELETANHNHFEITSAQTKEATGAVAGAIVRVRGLSPAQIEGMKKVMGLMGADGPVCSGFTCAQVATQALAKGAGIYTTRHGFGNFTIGAVLRKFARMQRREKPESPIKIEFYAVRRSLDYWYSHARRNDLDEIQFAQIAVTKGVVASGVLAGIVWKVSEFFFGL